MDYEKIIVDAATLYLLWQGNRIFAQQGPPVPPLDWRGKVKSAARYWPVATMAFMAIAIWVQPYLGPLARDLASQPVPMNGISLSGDVEIPASAATASITFPIEQPFRVDHVTTNWGSGVTLSSRGNGIDVAFTSPAPVVGGKMHWSLIAGDKSPQTQVFPATSELPLGADVRDPTQKEADVIRDLAIKGAFRVSVWCLMTETRSCPIAKKWRDVLKTAGWKPSGLNETDFDQPLHGLIVCARPDDSVRMAIGEFELALRENAIPVLEDCPAPDFAKDANYDFAFLVGSE